MKEKEKKVSQEVEIYVSTPLPEELVKFCESLAKVAMIENLEDVSVEFELNTMPFHVHIEISAEQKSKTKGFNKAFNN